MAQPVLNTVTLNSGSGGVTHLAETVGSDTIFAQLVAYSTGEGTINVVTSDEPLPCTAVITGDALTSLQLIDNIVATTDAVAGAAPVGVPPLAVRDDALTALTPIDGDFVPLRTDANGALWVIPSGTVTVSVSGTVTVGSHAVTNAGTFAVQVTDSGGDELAIDGAGAISARLVSGAGALFADDAPFTLASSELFVTGGIRDDALATLAAVEGDAVPLRVGSTGALWTTVTGTVTVTGAGGTFPVTDNGGALTVDWNGTAPPIGAGVEATALRVTLATDSTGVLSVDDNGGNLSVDWAGTVPPIGAGTEAAALRVTLATDSTGLVSVDDGGGVLTVDGAELTTLAGAVSGTEMQVDVVAALPAGTNNIGDVDVATQPARDRLTDNIGVALQTDAMLSDTTALTPKFAIIDAATSGDNTLVAAVVGKKIRVLSAFLVSAGTVTARFESGTAGTALTGQMNLVVNSGFTLPFNPVGWFETAANTLLNLELSAAVSVDGCLTYVEV